MFQESTLSLRSFTLTTLCIFGYGISLFGNGSSDVFLPLERMVLLGAVRCFTLLLLSAIICHTYPLPPIECSWKLLTPVGVVFLANLGLLPYAELVAQGSAVSILAPMTGCYAVIPAVFGLLAKGESRSFKKLLGIFLALIAVVVLASSSHFTNNANDEMSLPTGSVWLLFLCSIFLFGFGDIGAAYMGRGEHLGLIALLSGAGQAAFSLVFCLILIFSVPRTIDRAVPSVVSCAWIVFINVAGVMAWLSYVALTSLGAEASTFSPLCSLYVFVPVIIVAVRGETISLQTALGIVFAGLGGILLSVSTKPSLITNHIRLSEDNPSKVESESSVG